MNVIYCKKLKILLAAMFLVFFCSTAKGQRNLAGSSFIKGELCSTLTCSSGFGGSFGYGMHLHDSYWSASFGMENRSVKISLGDRMDYTHFYVDAEWMYMIWSTRDRRVSSHLGVGAFVGYEAYDTFERLPAYMDAGLGKGAFLYGVYPAVEISVYVHHRLSLFSRFALPIQFAAPTGWVKYRLGVGFRYEFL